MNLIDIFYVTAGGGHRSAALALRESLAGLGRLNIMIDLLDFSNRIFKWTYSSGYEFISEHVQTALKGMYRLTDQDRKSSSVLHMVDLLSQMNVPGFEHYITDNPDIAAVCTHFFPSTVLSRLKEEGKYKGKIYVCITDYGFHKMWFTEGVDRFFVGSATVKDSLLDLGVREERISLTGIPIKKVFSLPKDKTGIQNREGLKKGKFTLLFVTSSIPDADVLEILDRLCIWEPDLNLLIVSGRNMSIKEKLSGINSRGDLTIRKYGFIDNMDELMAISDLMITKPGGLTSSEALAMGVPLLMYRPIPYQETNNAEYIEKSGAGLLAISEEDLLEKIQLLYSGPSKLKQMAHNTRNIAFPKSSETIIRTILSEETSCQLK